MRIALRLVLSVSLSCLLLILGSIWLPELSQGRLSLATPVRADENFHTTLHTTYTVTGPEETTVSHVIKLTNKTPRLYVKQYALKISSPTISGVQVKSNGKDLPAEVVSTDNQTSIAMTFPDEVVGEGKTRTLEITFQNPDASVISGNVLEVLVPKLADSNGYDEYQVTLATPVAYGYPTRVTPSEHEMSQDGLMFLTKFNPKNGEGVTALFGETQIFEMSLRYHLENTGPNAGIAQIALPPDTPYQKMMYHYLEPLPKSVQSDQDGNWIATYDVPAQTSMSVETAATALLTLSANPLRMSAPPETNLDLSQPHWNSRQQEIQNLAQQYTTPRAIYDYVISTLNYDYSKLTGTPVRMGATQALANPTQANCQEFTDVFIGVARAANIPARRMTGYAYTENSVLRPLGLVDDVLHAWPEYFDYEKQLWVPIDPTWENTTGGVNYFDQFDLNHIVFAINGGSSVTPYPAGSYKLTDSNTKDVEITFGNRVEPVAADFKFEVKPQSFMGIPIPLTQEIWITNRTGVAWYNVTWQMLVADDIQSGTNLLLDTQTLPVILPYQTVHLPLKGYTDQTLLLKEIPVQVQLQYADDQQGTTSEVKDILSEEIRFRAKGQVFQTIEQPIVLIAVGASILIGALIAGGVLVYHRRRYGALRR